MSKKHFHGPEGSCGSIIIQVMSGTEVRVVRTGPWSTPWKMVGKGPLTTSASLNSGLAKAGRLKVQRATAPVCLAVLATGVGTLYEFPVAAITNCHDLSDLKPLRCIIV